VLLSRDEAYAVRALVTVAPVTTRIRHIPSEVSLGSKEGLPRPCVANLDSIATIAKTSLSEWITNLDSSKLETMESAFLFALGLEE